jgi:hypothetical protein
MYDAKQLQKKLPVLKLRVWEGNDGWKIIKIKPDSFICDKGFLHISAENELEYVAYDGGWTNNFRPFIHERLKKWAEKLNGYWEWDDPGSICFTEN